MRVVATGMLEVRNIKACDARSIVTKFVDKHLEGFFQQQFFRSPELMAFSMESPFYTMPLLAEDRIWVCRRRCRRLLNLS